MSQIYIDYLPGLGNSDHVCIYFHLSCYSTFKPNHTGPRYNVYRADFDSMHAAFYTIDWPDIMEPMNTKEAWEFFKTVLQDIIDKYVSISIGVQKKRNIYMSPEAFRIKKLKRKLWKNYTLSKTDHDYKAFKETRNKLRRLTRNLRIHHEQHIVSDIGRNPKSFWRYVNSHMKTRSGIDSIRCPNGSTVTSDQEKVELLNSYFASVFTDENLASFPLLE